MDVSAFVQELIGDGLDIGLSDDGERLRVDVAKATLSAERKELITKHKPEIVAFFQRRAWRPKVARGAIHYILHRSQRHLDRLNSSQRSEAQTHLRSNLHEMWSAYENQNAYRLADRLVSLYRATSYYVSHVANK
jgi:hypothetical protein